MAAETRIDPPPGGLDCLEVLEYLSDFVDNELPATVRSRVIDHVQACPNCARFGGAFAAIVGRLRHEAAQSPAPTVFNLQALLARLDDARRP